MNLEENNVDCIFCKIIDGELPSDIVYRDERVIGFRDINPIAPVHLLIIPRKHIPSIRDLTDDDLPLLGHMTVVANRLAVEEGIADPGYRLIINCGEEAGQTVHHIHMHLLGGRTLSWTA
jgi:histidine triad (HIT) family protein